ncbi:MAG: GNAT family N-acetyltransferase [Pseudohongiella sp.]|nr:GNAT family N-acetyltransferase [Pseudohongiella sp.]MDP2126794.1 GNAT family N-acetyltransferase [Pseudohongiella sp.]
MQGRNKIVTLREATIDDAPLLRHWDQQPHVVDSDPNDDWDWETELPRTPSWREQLIAEVDGVPIGFVQIIDPAKEESRYWGDVSNDLRAIDIWVGEADYLGQGFGSVMMRLAIGRCFLSAGVRAIIIDPLASNVRAHRFYQRLGFRPVARQIFGEDDTLVHKLERADYL